MFDKRSDYAQNKRDKNAIVYIGVTGPVLLTRAAFASEDELFQRLAEAEANAERARTCAVLMVQIRSCLTQKQFRRLWLLCKEATL